MGLIKREYTDLETVISAENLNAIQDAVIALEDGLFSVDNNKSGEVVTITDATKRAFRSIRVFGKTTQNGTPTPDAPVDFVNIGNSGSITVRVTGEDVNSMTIATPNGLPGIPVTSGGNYTDANGQQWICDEIDFGRGVYVQRLQRVMLTGAENWVNGYRADNGQNRFELSTSLYGVPGANLYVSAKCDRFQYEESMAIPATNHFRALTSNNMCYILFNPSTAIIPTEDVGAWKSWLAQNPTTIIIPGRTPVDIPLSAEELAAFSVLHTYRGNTEVSNDAGAYMDLEYVMDAKKYIASMVGQGGSAGRIVSVSLPASAWKGSGTLYSQVVSIPGITENSQVNLTPSVEQLSIFYDKDITFVTENDGGVVTIYVIGQKPQNDYTMPANIVEVIV